MSAPTRTSRFAMLIVCPSCASEHAVDPDRIGAIGRRVRCATCRESWFATPPAAELASPRSDLPGGTALVVAPPTAPVVIESQDHTVTPVRRRAAPKRASRDPIRSSRRPATPTSPRSGRAAGWIVALTCLAVPSALAARVPIVRAVPETAALFAALGLPVNLVHLALDDVTSTTGMEAGRPVLLVEGRIANVTRGNAPVPPVSIAIRAEDGDRLYDWTVQAGERELRAGESTTFRARLASPPPAGRRVTVTFDGERPATSVALR